VSIFGIGFQRHQRITVKGKASDVIVSFLALTNAELKVFVSIFGIGFQRQQRITVKRNPGDVMVYHDVIKYKSYDVIVSCLVLTNAKLKVVVSIFGIGFQRHQRLTVKRKGQ
jgi:hypothetical protein